jgi:hypothetical protein
MLPTKTDFDGCFDIADTLRDVRIDSTMNHIREVIKRLERLGLTASQCAESFTVNF